MVASGGADSFGNGYWGEGEREIEEDEGRWVRRGKCLQCIICE